MLFREGGVGIDKTKQVTLSVYAISSLTISQIQSVIKNVTSAESFRDRNHVTSKTVTIRDDQTDEKDSVPDFQCFTKNILAQYLPPEAITK